MASKKYNVTSVAVAAVPRTVLLRGGAYTASGGASSATSSVNIDISSKLDADIFDDLFEKVLVAEATETQEAVYAIRAKYGLYSDNFISALGIQDGAGGGAASGALDEEALAQYLKDNKYATQTWVLNNKPDLSGYVTTDSLPARLWGNDFVKGDISAPLRVDVDNRGTEESMLNYVAIRPQQFPRAGDRYGIAMVYDHNGNSVVFGSEDGRMGLYMFSTSLPDEYSWRMVLDPDTNCMEVEGDVIVHGDIIASGAITAKSDGIASVAEVGPTIEERVAALEAKVAEMQKGGEE